MIIELGRDSPRSPSTGGVRFGSRKIAVALVNYRFPATSRMYSLSVTKR
jgi:hypothetical protein